MRATAQSIITDVDQKALAKVCHDYRVQKLSVFGSVARRQARPDSDVDLLVVYEHGFTPTLFDLGSLAEALRPFFAGRDVDLVLPEDLHWFIKNQVLQSDQVIYEARGPI